MDNKPFKKANYSIDGFTPRSQQSGTNRLDPSFRQQQLRRRPAFHGTAQPRPLPEPGTISQQNTITPFTSSLPAPRSQDAPADAELRRKFGRRRRQATPTETPKSRFSRLRHANWKKGIKRTAAVLAVLIVLTGGWLGYKIFRDSSGVLGGNLLGILYPTKLNGEDKGRVNILLTGVSTDDVGHQGADLTDSIMIISLDTKNNKAQLISIPRDLWVNIPGYGYSKINAANAYGDTSNFSEGGYPKGGVGLLEKVLTQDLQIPIQYYANINYSAIRDGVNAVGGITLNIQSSDPRGLYDPSIDYKTHGPLVKLSKGKHTLNGEQALDLARARGDAYGSYGFPESDFDRTQHQRQMLIALKSKASSASVLSNPVKLGQLFDALGKNVKTNFKASEIRRLYDIGKKINSNNIQSISLNDAGGTNLLMNFTTADGESALAPAAGVGNYTQIQLFLQKLLSHNPVVREGAKVIVLNGGQISGLASKEGNVLTSKGLNVLGVADAPSQHTTDLIVDNSKGKDPATKKLLQQLFGTATTTHDTVGYPTADFIIILGTNQQPPNAVSYNGSSTSASSTNYN